MRLPVAVAGLLVGAGAVGAALALESVALLFASALLTGVGMGLVMGAGLAAINAVVQVSVRGEVTSSFFVILYVGISLPVIGAGLAADAVGLRTAGVAFSVCVGLLVLAVLAGLLLRRGRPRARV